MDQDTYIRLTPGAKRAVLAANACMFLCTVIYAFAIPIAMPKLLIYYDLMKYQALLAGCVSILNTVFTLVGGRLGDLIGRKKLAVAAILARAAVQLACVFHPSAPVFIGLYLAMGLTTGLLNSMHYSVISDICTQQEKPRIMGLFGTLNGVAMLIGIFGGGIIVDLVGPFNLFAFFVPLGVVSALLFAKFFVTKVSAGVRGMDVPGIVLIAAGLGLITVWCNLGTAASPFSAVGVALLAAFAAVLFFLLRYERGKSDGVLSLQLFRNRFFVTSFLVGMLINPMVVLCSSTLSMFGQITMGLSASIVGTLALPKNIIFFILPTFMGVWLSKDLRRYGTIMLACGLTIALGSVSAIFWNASTPLLAIYLTMLLFGVGTSCQVCFIQPYLQLSVHPEHIGSAGAMASFASAVGGIITNAVYSISYNAKYAELVTGGKGTLGQAVGFSFRSVAILSLIFGALICVCYKLFYIDPTSVDPRSMDD